MGDSGLSIKSFLATIVVVAGVDRVLRHVKKVELKLDAIQQDLSEIKSSNNQ